RRDLPAIHVPGGTQLNAPNYVTSDQLWGMGAAVERGELPHASLELHQKGACPTCGACQFMGSASTGQVLGEALGLALPGSALIPSPLTRHLRIARAAGKQILTLIEQDLRPSKILTREAFENAITLHAAVGRSTNPLLHLPAIAREVGKLIRRGDDAFGPEGGVAVLRGNLAPGGAVIKHFSVPKVMHVHVGAARVFDTEDRAVEALINREIKPGDVVVIRYEGPKANGMPEMYYATAII